VFAHEMIGSLATAAGGGKREQCAV